MSAEVVRRSWVENQLQASGQALANKQSQEALPEMYARYRALTPVERIVVDELLAEQLGSREENVRFDALAIVREFTISSALPALRVLADWLENQDSVGAPYEWAKVNRLIGFLTSQPQVT